MEFIPGQLLLPEVVVGSSPCVVVVGLGPGVVVGA